MSSAEDSSGSTPPQASPQARNPLRSSMNAMHEALRHTAPADLDQLREDGPPQPFTPKVTIEDTRDHGKIGRTSSRDSSGSGGMVRTNSNRSAGSGRSRGSSSPELQMSQRELTAMRDRLSETERELESALRE